MTTWLISLIRDELAKKLLWLFFGLLALGALFVLREARHNMPTSTLILAIVLFIAMCMFGIVEFIRRKSYRYSWYPHVRFHYEVIQKKITYRVDETGALHYSRSFLVRAMQDNLDGYTDRFVWTGGACDPPTGGVGVSSVQARLVAGIWTFFHVNFDRTLRKGEQHQFEVIWPVIHNWQDSSPFVSTSTDEPTRSLSFEIIIPEAELASRVALLEELRGIEAIYPFKTQTLQFDNNRLAVSPHPKLYRHYRLRWSWAGASAVAQIPDISTAVADPAKGLTS